jgi:hypothetical protein
MQIVADTHIHIYPCYDLNRSLESLIQNLSNMNDKAISAAFLAERHDCHFFSDVFAGRIDMKAIDSHF